MITIALVTIIMLFGLILLGVHIGYSLSLMSFLGVWWLTGKTAVAISILSATAFEAVRDYVFAVLPLFVLMGAFMGQSGAANDLYKSMNIALRRVPGGLGVATVVANAIFAAVTGVSVASAAVFARVSTPEMMKFNYKRSFALGCVTGSSVLGMLIPPSVLMIVYGMLAEVSIGKMFVAGVIPGIMLTTIYSTGIILMATRRPEIIGRTKKGKGEIAAAVESNMGTKDKLSVVLLQPLPVMGLIILVLGGIWGGLFTPTEASAFGALGAMIISLAKGNRLKEFKNVFLEVAATASSILFLLISAQMYSRMLTMSGLVTRISDLVLSLDVSVYVVVALFCLLIIVLGMILDSTSILLLTVPLMVPIMKEMGMDLIWFGIVMIIATEMGLLTPPFGMCVFAVKSALGGDITVEEIFSGSMPFLLMMLFCLIIVIAFPILSTWLPSLM